MTGGQADLGLNQEKENPSLVGATLSIDPSRPKLKVIKASAEETSAHEQKLDKLDQECEQGSLWRRLTSPP